MRFSTQLKPDNQNAVPPMSGLSLSVDSNSGELTANYIGALWDPQNLTDLVLEDVGVVPAYFADTNADLYVPISDVEGLSNEAQYVPMMMMISPEMFGDLHAASPLVMFTCLCVVWCSLVVVVLVAGLLSGWWMGRCRYGEVRHRVLNRLDAECVEDMVAPGTRPVAAWVIVVCIIAAVAVVAAIIVGVWRSTRTNKQSSAKEPLVARTQGSEE